MILATEDVWGRPNVKFDTVKITKSSSYTVEVWSNNLCSLLLAGNALRSQTPCKIGWCVASGKQMNYDIGRGLNEEPGYGVVVNKCVSEVLGGYGVGEMLHQ